MQSNKNEPKKKQPATLQAVFLFVLIALILFFAWYFRIYRCPSESILGIPCPLCGISRAVKSVARGDIRTAFYYHPLWPLIGLSFLLYLLYSFRIIRPSKRVFDIYCFVLAALLVICFILRHINGSPVVRTHFEDSLLYRIISIFR